MARPNNGQPGRQVASSDSSTDNLPIVTTDDSLHLADGAIGPILAALRASKPPLGFVEAGQNMLMAASNEFTGTLGVEAIKLARARNATVVDQDDVLRADKRLRGDLSGQRRAWLLALAGFTGGAGAAGIFAVKLAPSPIPHVEFWWITIIVLLVATAVLFFASYPRGRE